MTRQAVRAQKRADSGLAVDRNFLLGISLVIGGCCLNNVFLENIIIGDRASGQLLTLLQFVFIALMGLRDRFEKSNLFPGFRTKMPTTPLWWYVLLTSIFWTVSILNNMAYNFEISQPLHMVFRSSSLAVSLILGFLLFKKSYNRVQVVGVVIVTVGIFATTFADSKGFECGPQGCGAVFDFMAQLSDSRKVTGVGILTLGLLLSAFLGHLQSWGYEYFQKRDQDEAMFFQHFFSIFFFFPFSSSLAEHAQMWSESEPVGLGISWMWANVIGNLITQYICVRGVYLLVSTSGPVTATMVLTVRKFLSLIISVTLFGNVWTTSHWIGTVLVFGGAIMYGLSQQILSLNKAKEE